MKAFALIALLAVAAYGQTIVEVAESAGQFQTLLAAASAAGLVETLSGAGPFTVFAPTDDAFAALGQATVDNLLLPENREQLTSILLFHVVAGRSDSSALETAGTATSLQGGMLTFTSDAPGSLKVNGVTIIGANVAASNGLIHVIDQVLMPGSTGGGDVGGGETPSGMEESSSESSDDDDDDDSSSSSSSDDDDDSSSDDDDDSSSTMEEAMSPMAEEEPCEGESLEDVVAAAEMMVEEQLAKVTAQLTRGEVKALKDELDGHVEALEMRCTEACAPEDSEDDDDDDSSSSSSSSDDDDDSSSYSDESDCRHAVNKVIREGKKDVTKMYWSARSTSSDDDDDDSSSSDDDDSSSS